MKIKCEHCGEMVTPQQSKNHGKLIDRLCQQLSEKYQGVTWTEVVFKGEGIGWKNQ